MAMDQGLAAMLAHAVASGSHVIVVTGSGGGGGMQQGGSMGDESSAVEPVQGPGPDGSAQHEKAEGEAPQPAENAKPSPDKKPPAKPDPKAKIPPKKTALRGEHYG